MRDKHLNRSIFSGYIYSKYLLPDARLDNYGQEYNKNLLNICSAKSIPFILQTKHEKIIVKTLKYIYEYLNSFGYNLKTGQSTTSSFNVGDSGKIHFLTKTYLSISKTLETLGFNLVTGPEVEHSFYNFDQLNIPHGHSSRSKMDTFYLKENIILRTHTTSLQSRLLICSKNRMPLRVLSYGKVFRRDADKTHSPMFHQLEGLYVNKNVGFSELKGTLTEFIYKFFDKKTNIRWRSSFFSFYGTVLRNRYRVS